MNIDNILSGLQYAEGYRELYGEYNQANSYAGFLYFITRLDKELDNSIKGIGTGKKFSNEEKLILVANAPYAVKKENPLECIVTALVVGDIDGKLGEVILKDGNPLYCYEYLRTCDPSNKNEFIEKITQAKDPYMCFYCINHFPDVDHTHLKEVVREKCKEGIDSDLVVNYLIKNPDDKEVADYASKSFNKKEDAKALTEMAKFCNKSVNMQELFDMYSKFDKSFVSLDEWSSYLECEKTNHDNDRYGYNRVCHYITSENSVKDIAKHPDYMLGYTRYLFERLDKALEDAEKSEEIDEFTPFTVDQYDPPARPVYTNKEYRSNTLRNVINCLHRFEGIDVPQQTKDQCAKIAQDWANKNWLKIIDYSTFSAFLKTGMIDDKQLQYKVLMTSSAEEIKAFAKQCKNFKSNFENILNNENSVVSRESLKISMEILNQDPSVKEIVDKYQNRMADMLVNTTKSANHINQSQFIKAAKTLNSEGFKRVVQAFASSNLQNGDEICLNLVDVAYQLKEPDINPIALKATKQLLSTTTQRNLSSDFQTIFDKVTDTAVKAEMLEKFHTYMKEQNYSAKYRAKVKVKKIYYKTKKTLQGLLKREKAIEANQSGKEF